MQQNLQRHHQQQQQQHQQQYHHHQQQQQQQVNQSGILPLPLTTATAASGSGATGHVQQVPIHHLVLNPETNVCHFSALFIFFSFAKKNI